MNNDLGAAPHRRHPGPASPSSSADDIDVATAEDAAVVQSIEEGQYADVDEDTHSLTDSIRQHVVDGHLRYHAYHAGMYNFPNDETEQYRDDLKHSLTIHLCHGNYFYAPCHDRLERGAQVLDLGESCKPPWPMEPVARPETDLELPVLSFPCLRHRDRKVVH